MADEKVARMAVAMDETMAASMGKTTAGRTDETKVAEKGTRMVAALEQTTAAEME